MTAMRNGWRSGWWAVLGLVSLWLAGPAPNVASAAGNASAAGAERAR